MQSKFLLPRLTSLDTVEEVIGFGFYGIQGGTMRANGVLWLPGGMDPYGNDIIEAHARSHNCDLIVSLIDVWVLHEWGEKAPQWTGAAHYSAGRWVPWTPVDSFPVPKMVIEHCRGAYWVLPYAKNGEAQLKKQGIHNSYFIPHGAETSIFKPLDGEAKRAFKRRIGFEEDCYLCGIVAANKGNPSRKAFHENLLGFKLFYDEHPDARLYLHTDATARTQGLDMAELLRFLEIPANVVRFPDGYQYWLGFSTEYMAEAYNGMDVLLGATSGEGFGLPVLESQACGTPVIVTDHSAMTELCGSGYLVKDWTPWYTPLGAYQAIPNPGDIKRGLESIYYGDRFALRRQAVEFGQEFSWDKLIANFWKPWLETVRDDVLSGPPAYQLKRQFRIE